MSVLLRTNYGHYRVTVSRPGLNNGIVWSVTQNPDRCSVGGIHDDGVADESRWTRCRKCDRVAEIQTDHPVGHGFLYSWITDGLTEALVHAEYVKAAADSLDAAIALPDATPFRRRVIETALTNYENAIS